MAKQKGTVKIEGSIGDLTYYKSQDGYLVKERTSLSAERISSDPNFQRTRENNAEFGRAGKAGKTMRHSINALIKNAKDSKLVSRLTKNMMKVLKTDATHLRGERTVSTGDLTLLKDFEFNLAAILSSTVYAPFTTSINRVAGTLTVDLPAFVPSAAIIAPSGATHFQLVSAGAEIDFDNQKWVASFSNSNILPWDANPTAVIQLSNPVTAASALPLFLVMGIQFFQEINGLQYPLLAGSFNALSVIDISIN